MNKILLTICVFAALLLSITDPPDSAIAILFVTAITIPIVFFIRKYAEDKDFLTDIFLIALLARLLLGFAMQLLDIKILIAEDTTLYDALGMRLVEIWQGLPVPNDALTQRALSTSGAGWGMTYLVAALYYICGQSILAGQSFCAVVGAATSPMVYFCAHKIFLNKKVAKLSAIAVAVFPSFIIWSAQMLKDGLIIFMLVVAMTMILQLLEKFNYWAILLLLLCLFGILTLRFYIFYMVAIAVVGSFVIGLNTKIIPIFRNMIIILVLGLGLTYFGILRTATSDIDQYASFETLQRSRQDLATSANSGFGEDIDVGTASGAITAIPTGLAYLMLAPFPWQIDNLRQLLTLPETLVWWSMLPFMFSGLVYAVRNRLRRAIPSLVFSLMLTVAYSVFQGNVGTAYRQRTQIQVFLFIFIAVGLSLFKERRENRKLVRQSRRQRLRMHQQMGQ